MQIRNILLLEKQEKTDEINLFSLS